VASFTPFNSSGHLKQTWRHLPHWNQHGATYFVTFRLADSLPTAVLARLGEFRALSDSEQFFWMDDRLDAGSGRCLFSDPRNASMMAAALLNFDGVHYNLGAYAVMPNHVHALVQPLETESMTLLLHRWKSYSARQLQRMAGANGTVWQEERFDRIVRDEYELRTFHEYILGNPSAAQLPESTFMIGQGGAQWFE
jgi:putative DNA methylase